MANFDSNVSRQYYTRLAITWGSYNISANTTPLNWVFSIYAGAYTVATSNQASGNVKINGVTVYTQPGELSLLTPNKWYKLASGSMTIAHNQDGTKSVAVSSTLSAWVGGYGFETLSVSKTQVLPTIPRTSTFTIPSSFTMGDAFKVSITRASSSFTHWVELYDGGTRLYSSGNTVGTSDSVNVALSMLAARSPNAMSRSFTVKVSTYNGSTIIGSTSKNITGNVPSTVKPEFSAVTVSENVSTVASLVGAYVQTKSRLNLAITGANGIYGSTIRSYNITGVGHNVNSSSTTTGFVSVSGNQTIKGTVTDSRGQTYEKSIVVNILPYSAPSLSGLSFRRTFPDKTEAPLGDNVTVMANVKVQSLIVNGVEKNSIKYHVQSAQSGGAFADKANTTSTNLTESYSDVWSGYSVDYSYNFRVRAGDVFGFGGWFAGVVPTGIVTQQWGSKTTSFGKMIDDTSYNVQVGSGGIHSEGKVYSEGHEVALATDTGWTNIQLLNGFTAYSSGSVPKYRVKNGILEVSGAVSPPSGNTVGTQNGQVFGKIPHLPSHYGFVGLMHGSGTAVWMLRWESNGRLIAERYRDENGTMTNPTTSNWLPFQFVSIL